jgi:hypothetical protein
MVRLPDVAIKDRNPEQVAFIKLVLRAAKCLYIDACQNVDLNPLAID